MGISYIRYDFGALSTFPSAVFSRPVAAASSKLGSSAGETITVRPLLRTLKTRGKRRKKAAVPNENPHLKLNSLPPIGCIPIYIYILYRILIIYIYDCTGIGYSVTTSSPFFQHLTTRSLKNAGKGRPSPDSPSARASNRRRQNCSSSST